MSAIESEVQREDNACRNLPTEARRSANPVGILMGRLLQMRKRIGRGIGWPSAASLALFALACLLAYPLGTTFTQDFAAPFWLSDAVLLCALLLSRPNEWWLYVLLTVSFRLFLVAPRETTLWVVVASSAIGCLKNALCACLLRRLSSRRAWFDNFHEFGKYFLVAVVLGPGFSGFAAAASRAIAGTNFWTIWKIWFLGDALASLLLAPFILLAFDDSRFFKKIRHLEASVVAVGLVLASYIAFRDGLAGQGSSPFIVYLPLPFLLWAAMEFGPIGASGSLLLMSVLVILETRTGRGPFPLQSSDASLLSTQLFLFVGSVPFMSMSVITNQRRKIESQLRQNGQQFRSLVDDVPVMVWMSGTDTRCTFFNKPWLDFTGLSPEEQTEQDWVGRIHPEDRERCVMEYLTAFKARQDFTLEYRVLHNDGAYRWVLHNGIPRYAADGGFLGYIGSRIDFTDRRLAEEQLRKVSTQRINARESENCRIGHELHEDLAQKVFALSVGLSHFSRNCAENRKPTADFEQLQEQVSDVCKDIVRLSHRLSPVTVGGLGLSTALRNLCNGAADNHRVALFVQNEQPTWIPEDVSLTLYSIAKESLQNALTHSGATDIRVELTVSTTTAYLSVRDNGCGFVVDSMMMQGLGLFKMSEQMKSSGGVFRIVSNPGEGTAIIATMPLTQSIKVKAVMSGR